MIQKSLRALERGWVPKLRQVYNQSSNQESTDRKLIQWPIFEALHSKLLGLKFRTTGWLQSRPSHLSFHGHYQVLLEAQWYKINCLLVFFEELIYYSYSDFGKQLEIKPMNSRNSLEMRYSSRGLSKIFSKSIFFFFFVFCQELLLRLPNMYRSFFLQLPIT